MSVTWAACLTFHTIATNNMIVRIYTSTRQEVMERYLHQSEEEKVYYCLMMSILIDREEMGGGSSRFSISFHLLVMEYNILQRWRIVVTWGWWKVLQENNTVSPAINCWMDIYIYIYHQCLFIILDSLTLLMRVWLHCLHSIETMIVFVFPLPSSSSCHW